MLLFFGRLFLTLFLCLMSAADRFSGVSSLLGVVAFSCCVTALLFSRFVYAVLESFVLFWLCCFCSLRMFLFLRLLSVFFLCCFRCLFTCLFSLFFFVLLCL